MTKSFKISKRGYAPEEVQAYIDELEAVIDQYKSKEHYISTALVDSHMASMTILEEAEIHAFEIEKNALVELEHFKEALDLTKKRLLSFQNDYDTFVGNFKSSMETIQLHEAACSLETLEKELNKYVKKPAAKKRRRKKKKTS
ncbi:hypothetical protein HZI73_20790 [Vallitalea pronyensis]|uniref:DivIVA domain-containing protein n=1 Tax=Vallitalea pronyensis TaxID=1348613 RepID=A0A8J8MMQ1_9FIRM|nr:hypothetical protein [Vallitalea pronyensis]QUI24590.1 hypothetical protein HZI73_20790 [Vallitalea pronyensis]